MLQEKVQVLFHEKIGSSYYRIGLACHQRYSEATPGQFIMLRLPEQIAPLLRRPFSIHRLIRANGRTKGLELLYKVVGAGTEKLSMVKPGDFVDILGPLGNGFSVPDELCQVYIAAGGVGVAPMLFLASFLREKHIESGGIKIFLGGRSEEDLLCRDAFVSLAAAVHLTTDDGSAGDQCFVTHPLEAAVREKRPDMIYACGPLEMLSCIVGIAEKYTVPCQVSIETMMACGIGACLGCALEPKNGAGKYLHACVDGPVFDAKTLKI